MSRGVIVSHPERQHSHRLAAALQEANMLECYFSGMHVPGGFAPAIDRHVRLPATMNLRRLATRLPRIAMRDSLIAASYRLFDKRIARRLRSGPAAIVGYEAGCLDSFRRAHAFGMSCILDAASLESGTQSDWLPGSNTPASISLKRREVELAHIIIACSELAAESYRRAWPEKPVAVLPLGVDLDRFSPASARMKQDIDFLFVGHVNATKGADILADALEAMSTQGERYRCMAVTNRATAEPVTLSRLSILAELRGPSDSAALAKLMQRARLLILPSRIDSFGQVVAEALACGTPVLVSDHVGASELVEQGRNGWVVRAGDAAALANGLSFALRDPEKLRKMRLAARQSVEHRTWENYSSRAVNLIGECREKCA